MTFQALRDTIVRKNLLSKFFFAEDITVCPRNGPQRTVTAKVRVSQLVEEGGEGIQRAEVLCMRDEDDDLGGIANPAMGDVIIRADGSKYGFAGEILDSNDRTHKLVYTSNYPYLREAQQ